MRWLCRCPWGRRRDSPATLLDVRLAAIVARERHDKDREALERPVSHLLLDHVRGMSIPCFPWRAPLPNERLVPTHATLGHQRPSMPSDSPVSHVQRANGASIGTTTTHADSHSKQNQIGARTHTRTTHTHTHKQAPMCGRVAVGAQTTHTIPKPASHRRAVGRPTASSASSSSFSSVRRPLRRPPRAESYRRPSRPSRKARAAAPCRAAGRPATKRSTPR